MKIKLLHIGLGKTGTNALSQSIFPEIEKKCNTNFINLYQLIHKHKVEHLLENQRYFNLSPLLHFCRVEYRLNCCCKNVSIIYFMNIKIT